MFIIFIISWGKMTLRILYFYFIYFRQMKELNQHLETEKASRTDLEMYVAVLNTQKSVLQEDADNLRAELHEGIDFIVVSYLDRQT